MADEDGYQLNVFNGIESIISCELPSMTKILEEHNGPLPRPPLPIKTQDVWMKDQPCMATLAEDKFAIEFCAFVEELAIRCNWHQHMLEPPKAWRKKM